MLTRYSPFVTHPLLLSTFDERVKQCRRLSINATKFRSFSFQLTFNGRLSSPFLILRKWIGGGENYFRKRLGGITWALPIPDLFFVSFSPKISSVQLDAFYLNVWFSRIVKVKWFRDNEFAIKTILQT
jgi:hypothetical protein